MTKIIQNQWFFSDWCPNGGIKPTASWAGFWSSHIPLRIPKVNSGVTSSRNQLQFHGPESWNIATHTCAGTGIVLVKVLAWLLQIMHWRLCNCGYQTRGPEKSWSLPQNPLPASKTLQYPKKEVYIMCVYIYIKLKTKDLLPCGNQTWPWKITDSYMMFPWTAHQVKGMESRAPAGCEVGWATKGACYDRLVGPPALASTWKKSKKQGCCVTKMMCSHRFCHILPYGWSGSNKERLIKPQIQKIWGCYNQGPSGSFRAFRLDATKQKWDQTWNCPRWNTTGNRVKAGKGR